MSREKSRCCKPKHKSIDPGIENDFSGMVGHHVFATGVCVDQPFSGGERSSENVTGQRPGTIGGGPPHAEGPAGNQTGTGFFYSRDGGGGILLTPEGLVSG